MVVKEITSPMQLQKQRHSPFAFLSLCTLVFSLSRVLIFFQLLILMLDRLKHASWDWMFITFKIQVRSQLCNASLWRLMCRPNKIGRGRSACRSISNCTWICYFSCFWAYWFLINKVRVELWFSFSLGSSHFRVIAHFVQTSIRYEVEYNM
jgi:hypothetical protein